MHDNQNLINYQNPKSEKIKKAQQFAEPFEVVRRGIEPLLLR